jgi:hypothetical protein
VALKTNGALYQWGNKNTLDPDIIIQIGTDTDWSTISAGGEIESSMPSAYYYNLAIKANGTLWGFGNNSYGQMGLGDWIPRNNPSQIGTDSNWVALSAGGDHAIGRKDSNAIWFWGGNSFYQLGVGSTVNQNIPISFTRSQPGNLIAKAVAWTKINLTWTDNSYNETGFKIERSLPSSVDYSLIATVDADTISYSDETVTRGNTYYYRIKAVYADIDSNCSNEAVGSTILWEEKLFQNSVGSPSSRQCHSMVWDSVGQRVIMFGGYNGLYKNDLWRYYPATNTWEQKFTSITPTARFDHSMVWDSDGQRVIMFGGYSSSGSPRYKNDLWWYSPVTNTWIDMTTSGISPAVRSNHSMVWDSAGQRVIMFGGYNGLYKNDLWRYYPVTNTWEQKFTSITPTARSDHSMVWDSDGQRVIMFGGYGSDSSMYKNDLWWYDPAANAWTQKILQDSTGSPSSRQGYSMVWNGTKVIMFGGYSSSSPRYKNDLWWYDPAANTWEQKVTQNSGSSASARRDHLMIFDSIEQKLIVFGGYDASYPFYRNDLWWWW